MMGAEMRTFRTGNLYTQGDHFEGVFDIRSLAGHLERTMVSTATRFGMAGACERCGVLRRSRPRRLVPDLEQRNMKR